MMQVLECIAGSAALALRYGLLIDELNEILALEDLSPTQSDIISGMLSTRQIRPFKTSELVCSVDGGLADRRNDYLLLSICFSRKFLAADSVSPNDLHTFARNGVSVISYHEADFVRLIADTTDRVVGNWTLADGGTFQPAPILSEEFSQARRITVYDKYFGRAALRVLNEVMSSASVKRGKLDLELIILCGNGPKGGLSEGDVRNALSAFLLDPTRVLVCKSRRPASNVMDTHDRYIQVDQRVTFEFSAGVGMFYEGAGGVNRSGSIRMSEIFDSYSVADVERQDSGEIITIRF